MPASFSSRPLRAEPMLSLLGTLLLLSACGGDSVGLDGVVQFVDRDIDIGLTQSGSLQIVNGSSTPVERVEFQVIEVFDETGVEVGGADLTIFSTGGLTIAPDRKLDFGFQIVAVRLPPGRYRSTIGVFVDGELSDRSIVKWGKTQRALTLAHRVEVIDPGVETLALGDTLDFDLAAFTERGDPVQTFEARWYVLPTYAGEIDKTGVFVPGEPGDIRIVVAIGNEKGELPIRITP